MVLTEDSSIGRGGPHSRVTPPATTWAVALVMVCSLSACAGKVKPPPEFHVALQFVASADVNPDPSGRPSPVAVSVVQLKAVDAFMNADFFTAANPTSAALQGDVASREDLTLQPGQTKELAMTAAAGVTAIGVIVSYRDIEHARWRAQAPLPISAKGKRLNVNMTVQIGAEEVSMTVGNAK